MPAPASPPEARHKVAPSIPATAVATQVPEADGAEGRSLRPCPEKYRPGEPPKRSVVPESGDGLGASSEGVWFVSSGGEGRMRIFLVLI